MSSSSGGGHESGLRRTATACGRGEAVALWQGHNHYGYRAVAPVTARDRQIRVTGKRREQIDIHRLADLIVRLARSGQDFTSLLDTAANRSRQQSEESDDDTKEPA
jgi:hypothetical protein